MACETYNFIKRNITLGELKGLINVVRKRPEFLTDEYIRETICNHCEFMKEDCDFRAGKEASPCGGYMVIEYLISQHGETRFPS